LIGDCRWQIRDVVGFDLQSEICHLKSPIAVGWCHLAIGAAVPDIPS